MTYELMKTRFDEIEKLEKNMMRPLTDEEKQFVFDHGSSEFIENYLHFDHDDDFTFKRIKTLISAYCTQSEDAFYNEVHADNGSALMVLKTIVNALEVKEKSCGVDCICNSKKGVEIRESEPEYSHEYNKDFLQFLLDLVKDSKKETKGGLKCDPKEETKCEIFNRVTECEGDCDKCDWITYLISCLKKGEELELSDKEIESICDRLHETENNYAVKIINNKISAKF